MSKVNEADQKYKALEETQSEIQGKTSMTGQEAEEFFDDLKQDVEELKTVLDELEALGTNFNPLVEITPATMIDLEVSSGSEDCDVTIKIVSESVTEAWADNPGDSMGTLSNESGTTTHTGYFNPNSNYGTITFVAETDDGEQSNEVTITVTGQTRAEAEEVKEEFEEDVEEGFGLVADIAAGIGGIITAIIGAVLAILGGSAVLIVLGVVIVIIGILWAIVDAAEFRRKKRELLDKFDEELDGFIDGMPE